MTCALCVCLIIFPCEFVAALFYLPFTCCFYPCLCICALIACLSISLSDNLSLGVPRDCIYMCSFTDKATQRTSLARSLLEVSL